MTPHAWLSAAASTGGQESERPLDRLGDFGTVRDLRISEERASIYMKVPGVRRWPHLDVIISPAISAP